MKRLFYIVFFLILNISSLSFASLYDNGPLTVEGYIKNETAIKTRGFDDFNKIKNIIDLRALYKVNDEFSFFVHFNKFYDLVYNVEDELKPYKHEMCTNRRTWSGVSWMRELYFDYFSSDLDIRLGKQIVTWGTTDLQILDRINPVDYREFILPAWNEIKIPLWMTKIEYSPTLNGTLQFLMIPDQATDFYPVPGAPFSLGIANMAQEDINKLNEMGYHVNMRDYRQGQNIKNSKFGLRWRDVIKNFEYTLNYLYGWDSEKVTTVDTSTMVFPPSQPAPALPPTGSTFNIDTKYKRLNMFGSSFSHSFISGRLAGLVLKGEVSFFKDKLYPYDAEGKTKYKEINECDYAIGLEKYVVKNWLVSFQFFQYILSKKDVDGQKFLLPSGGTRGQVQTMCSLKIMTDFRNERIKPEFLVIYDDDNDWRFSPKVNFEATEKLNINFGMHLFAGDKDTFWGQFRDMNEVYTEIKWSF